MPYLGASPNTTIDQKDLNGQKLIIDADADTSIHASTDDQIDIEISGADDFQFTANTFTAQSGSTIAAQALTATTGVFSSTVSSNGFNPDAADGAALGSASLEFSDLYLADGGIIYLGNDQDVTLTHVADTGLLLNSTMALQFNDASQYINAPSNAILDINATDEIELNATLADINANVEISGTLTVSGVQTLAAAIAGADQTVARVNLKDYGEVTSALGSAGGARTIDLEDGNSFSATVSASTVTWTFSNPTASDELCGFTLVQVNGGSQTVNWPGSVDWAGGTAPTLTSSGTDILVFFTIDGGTIWHGMSASLDSK